MARNKSQISTQEFPLLKSLGLKTLSIVADGNCLFSALSDQVYGHTGKAFEIRSIVVQYLREHSEDFKAFLNYDGERRTPLRRCARGRFLSANPTTPEDAVWKIDVAWERYLTSMARSGTWGDNLTIRAFACAFYRTVCVYQEDGERDIAADEERGYEKVRIAYHTWNHYSSVRSINSSSSGHSNRQANAQTRGRPKCEKWMANSVTSTTCNLSGARSPTNRAHTTTKGNTFISHRRSFSATTSSSLSPSTLSLPESSNCGTSLSGESDEEMTLKFPIRRKSLVVNKDLLTFEKSPASFSSSQSSISKRALDSDGDSDEPIHSPKRFRKAMSTEEIPHLSLRD